MKVKYENGKKEKFDLEFPDVIDFDFLEYIKVLLKRINDIIATEDEEEEGKTFYVDEDVLDKHRMEDGFLPIVENEREIFNCLARIVEILDKEFKDWPNGDWENVYARDFFWLADVSHLACTVSDEIGRIGDNILDSLAIAMDRLESKSDEEYKEDEECTYDYKVTVSEFNFETKEVEEIEVPAEKVRNCLERQEKMRSELYPLLEEEFRYMTELADYINEKLCKLFDLDFNMMKRILLNDVRKYAAENWAEEYKILRRQLQDFKESRAESIGTEHWVKLLEYEEEMMKCAAKEGKEKDSLKWIKRYPVQGYYSEMYNHPKLMRCTLDALTDDELIDVDYAIKCEVDYDEGKEVAQTIYGVNDKSLNFFSQMLLRANLIRCGIHPELTSGFERWIKGEDFAGESVEPWIADFRRYVEPLRGHYAGRNFDGLWNELIKSNGEIRKRDGKAEIRLFDARSKDKVNSFDKGTLQRVVGYMHKSGMIEGGTNKEVASYLEVEENVGACEAQIMFGLDRNTTIDEENTKKIKAIIENFK